MFASNQSPIPSVSARRLLSTTPGADLSDLESRRSSLDSIDPIPPSTVKFADQTPYHYHDAPPPPYSNNAPYGLSSSSSRSRTRSKNHPANDQSSFKDLCCLCPHIVISLSRAFSRVSAAICLCAVLNVGMSTYYAWLDSNQSEYGPDDWQSCVVYGEAPPGTGYNTRFSIAAAAAGQQTVIFSMIAAGTVYRALHHPEWIVSTLSVVAYAFVGCFCFFSFSPAIPFPTNLTANVFILIRFVKEGMYDDVILDGAQAATTRGRVLPLRRDDDSQAAVDDDDGVDDGGGGEPHVCEAAYRYNQTFLYLQYVTIGLVCLLFLLGLLAETRRRKMGLISNQTTFNYMDATGANGFGATSFFTSQFPNLVGTRLPMCLSLTSFIGFFVMLFGKNLTALIALDAVEAASSSPIARLPASFFPFAAGGLDITTVLFVTASMAIIRGWTRQRVSAFRLAACSAFLHVLLSWPSVVSSWRFAVVESILFGENAQTYFEGSANWFSPDEHNAKRYVVSVRCALFGQLLTFVSMHLAIVACWRCYMLNKDHPLTHFDPNPPSEARALLFNDNVVTVDTHINSTGESGHEDDEDD